MAELENITPQILETLYLGAVVLSDEVRAAFAVELRANGQDTDDATCVAFALEALRAKSRMMNATAWLLNHRAYFRGELSEKQYRKCRPLETDTFKSTPDSLELLPPHFQTLVHATEEFCSRLMRLERGGQNLAAYGFSAVPTMLSELRMAVTDTVQTIKSDLSDVTDQSSKHQLSTRSQSGAALRRDHV